MSDRDTRNGTGRLAKCAFALLAVVLAGCSAIEGRMAADSEEILTQAGFQREPLDEPGLPARQLVQAGSTYSFADPDFCQCVYVGDNKEYAALQRLRTERTAERDWVLRRSSYGNTYSPIMWGAWDPEGLDLIKAPIATGDTRERSALK